VKALDALPQKAFKQVVLKLFALQGNPKPQDCKKLKGSPNGYRVDPNTSLRLTVGRIPSRKRGEVYDALHVYNENIDFLMSNKIVRQEELSGKLSLPELYEKDIYLWTEEIARLLKARQFYEVDWQNVIEEIEALGRSERDKLLSSLKVLIWHLLKWKYQPTLHTDSWRGTIKRERRNIEEYLEDTPSLKRFLVDTEWMTKIYRRAVREAADETGLGVDVFPVENEFSLEQLLDADFLPEAADNACDHS
jgi:hypothetical protein